MKLIIKLIGITALALSFVACDDNMGDRDTRVAGVKTLVTPENGTAVVLEPTATAAISFTWTHVPENEIGTAIYQLAFDKADGDFSRPVYLIFSADNGYANSVNITHKQMNKIASMMGVEPSTSGSFKWTVLASKGTNVAQAGPANTITITRLAGFDEIPVDLFVTGEASEGGTDRTKAHRMTVVGEGEFEVYTKLKGGQPFYFTNGASDNPKTYSTADGLIKESGTTTVPTDGVYRITLDYTLAACTYTLVNKIMFYFCPTDAMLFELPYVGYGVFKAEKQTVTFKQESWGRDQRYKFRMLIRENSGADTEKTVEWGTLNATDSPPTATSPASYYYLMLIDTPTQWDNKWKMMSDFDGVPADYTIYLQADGAYTHTITK